MKVLIACEFSGTVRDAFIKQGHDAMSCDLEPTDIPGPHYQGDVLDIIDNGWDLMIAHPPCTHLASSGARHFAKKIADGRQQQGIDFFMALANCNISRYAIENPIGIISSKWRKPDQIIQPWQFGHTTTKSTCLWLKNLPVLLPVNIVQPNKIVTLSSGKKMSQWYYETGCLNYKNGERAKARNKTFQGIANAMAQQWGNL
jgi:site-specific DNA-cytosine methylase